MAYPAVPRADPARAAASARAIRELLADLAGRKEFCAATGDAAGAAAAGAGVAGFGLGPPPALHLPGLRLHGAQVFVRNFENPDTEYTRLLVKWQTGTGKSIAAISIGHEFVRQYRARAALGARPPAVFVISFTARETIQEDMLQHPEFGFVAAAEVEELRRLRAAAGAAGPASAEARQLSGLVGVLRRRITDRARGGYYQFYGYKEFANRLFGVTRRGVARGFDVQAIYGRAEGGFGERLAEAVRRGDVVVNGELLDELRGGLLVADEVHNVYNILESNNYGIAIQYALDALGAEAPRAVFMSATPMTGSAAEIVDLLNLLVPRAALPGGMPLRRADFFARARGADGDGGDSSGDSDGDSDSGDSDDSDSDSDGDGSGDSGGDRSDGGPGGAGPGGAPGGDGPGEAARPRAQPFVASQLREGALERIGLLAAGRAIGSTTDQNVRKTPARPAASPSCSTPTSAPTPAASSSATRPPASPTSG